MNAQVYESSGAVRSLERRPYPPGMFTRRGKQSTYALGLAEKQKIKHYYGLSEKQLRRYFERATRMKGNTGELMLLLCERRLDNVIRRAGLAHSRPQARQGIVHCHFKLNGVKLNKPSALVRPGDVITVRERKNLHNMYRDVTETERVEPAGWFNAEPEHLRVIVSGYPMPADVSLPIEVGLVVEFMSR
ncbi:30S ribosomal protein S4 [Kolteria novifilia]|uniref:30S ribosomal protein S4 n=1 Tax=Kolteria novifilia TaxID=2527975 RepID=UPI003AF3CF3F